ncbi:MAG: thermonuclease family protein [Bradyrhizobiaceae bacterium]|nr:MAG: thermonuclease family protein [Bradyrhizobiaceae bacterium]
MCVGAVFFIAASDARAACDFEIQGEGRVAAVTDARSLRLADGGEVRLAGIELPANADPRFLRDLVLGREVTLRSTSDAPDRYGRLQAFVFMSGGDGIALQSRLLSQGWAMASGTVADKGCAAELGAAEKEARVARRGLWASPAAIKNAESTADILAETGRFTLIEGKVVSARDAGATFYVNFGKRWIQGFAVMVSRRMMASFEAAGMKLGALENRRIRVRGFVERRNGAPRIEAFAPGQIELIDESRTAATAGSE